jgi:hypothetical protein
VLYGIVISCRHKIEWLVYVKFPSSIEWLVYVKFPSNIEWLVYVKFPSNRNFNLRNGGMYMIGMLM